MHLAAAFLSAFWLLRGSLATTLASLSAVHHQRCCCPPTPAGIFSKEEAAKIKPEGHKRPHFIDEDEEDEDRKPCSSGGAKLPLKRAQQLVLGRDRA